VACGDVYSVAPNAGRGGWTWYTGSAAWMYRVGIEYILGLRFTDGKLMIDPVIPSRWPGFEATLRRGAATWRIVVENPNLVPRGVVDLSVDGASVAREQGIALTDDGKEHEVRVVLGYPELQVSA
jgi:cyclic beta-1,2-glucan synthetase